jgi:protein O-mannosyl-transferase
MAGGRTNSHRPNYYSSQKKCQVFLREKQTLSAPQNRLQNAPMSRPRLIALLLMLGTLAIYLPVSGYGYEKILKYAEIFFSESKEPFPQPSGYGFSLYDDTDYVTENPVVQNGLSWAGVKWAFTTWHASNWHPLTWISHMADCQIFGLNPGAPHCENVLLHAANAVLLFALLLRLTSLRADASARQSDLIWPGAFAAALFAWHPLHVESVAWVAERKDVLSTFFGLLALLSYTKYAKENCRRSFWFALIFFALGLLAKPMLVTLPFVMLLLDYWPLKRFPISDFPPSLRSSAASRFPIFLRLAFEKWPFFLLAAGSCVLTFLAQHTTGAVATLENVPMHYRLCNAPLAYARYLLKIIWPENLCIFYPLPETISPLVITATVVLIFISAASWFARKRAPYWLVGWLWFLGTLVPVIGLVQVGGAAMADRYSYFPSVGIFLAAALGVRDAAEKFRFSKTIVATAAGLILAACLFLTHRQLNYWRDDIALFSHAIDVTPNNDTAHLNLGFAFGKAGMKTEATAEYRRALQIEPNRADTHNNLAIQLDNAGKTGEAVAEFQEALRINPKYVPAHNNFGTLLVELGRYDEAMKHYAEAAQLDPADWHAPYLMGKALLKQARDAEAIPYFRNALTLNPNNLPMLVFLAQVLASDENPQVRDGQTAFALASKANALTGGAQPVMLDTLAMAYAELGAFDDAKNAAQEALELDTAYNATNDLPDIRERLQLYQNHQPFRQSFTNTPAKN